MKTLNFRRKLFFTFLFFILVYATAAPFYFLRSSGAGVGLIRACKDGAKFLLGNQYENVFPISVDADFYIVEDATETTPPFLSKTYLLRGDFRSENSSIIGDIITQHWPEELPPGTRISIDYAYYHIIETTEDCSIDDERADIDESLIMTQNYLKYNPALGRMAGQPIGFDNNQFESKITVNEDVIIEDVNFGFSINHESVGGLKGTIIDPYDQESIFFEGNGGLGNHMGLLPGCFQCSSSNKFWDYRSSNLYLGPFGNPTTYFPYFMIDDDSTFQIDNAPSANAPFAETSYQPIEDYSAVEGKNAKGEWTFILYWEADNWIHDNVGTLANAVNANGNLSINTVGISQNGFITGTQDIFYRSIDNQIQNIHWLGGPLGPQEWQHNPIGQQTSAAPAASSPASYALSNGDQAVFYRGQDNHIHAIFWDGSSWSYQALGQSLGASKANGRPEAHFSEIDGTRNVYYRGLDNRIHELFYDGSRWHYLATGQWIGAPLADDSPSSFKMSNGDQYVFYMGREEHIHALFWDRALETWSHIDLTNLTGAAMAGSEPTSHFSEIDNTINVYYRGKDNHLHELFHNGTQWVYLPTGQTAGAPKIKGIPSSYKDPDGTQYVYYRGQDNQIHVLYWNGTSWIHTAAGQQAGGPEAAGNPIGTYFNAEGAQTVFYRGIDNQVHELFLINPDSAEDGDLWNWVIDIEPMRAQVPTISLDGSTQNTGDYLGPVTVNLSSINVPAATAVISYTLDGTVPDHTSPIFSGSFDLDVPNGQAKKTFTLSTLACCNGYAPSAVISETFTVWANQVATPLVTIEGESLGGNKYRNLAEITLSTTTSQSTIRYTLDGSQPTASSTVYSGVPLVIDLAPGQNQRAVTIKAVAFRNDYLPSAVSSETVEVVNNFTTYVPLITR